MQRTAGMTAQGSNRRRKRRGQIDAARDAVDRSPDLFSCAGLAPIGYRQPRRAALRGGTQAVIDRAVTRAADSKRSEIAMLIPIALEMAERAGVHGVTVHDVRIAARQRGKIEPGGPQRALSYLGAVMRAAGLVPSGKIRRSHIPESHGNIGVVWLSPTYAPQRFAGRVS